MYNEPQRFLNGTAPLNVTAASHACVFQLNESTSDTGVCTDVTGTDADSYLWCVSRKRDPRADADTDDARVGMTSSIRRSRLTASWAS